MKDPQTCRSCGAAVAFENFLAFWGVRHTPSRA